MGRCSAPIAPTGGSQGFCRLFRKDSHRVASTAAAWTLAGLQCARFAWTVWQRRALELIPPGDGPGRDAAPDAVSLIIPARDEAPIIADCVAHARNQTYPGLEILVVDDCSQDETAAIVRRQAALDARVKLVTGEPLPAGWIGKSWAIHQGAEAARGEWLLFLDADTQLLAGGVAGAVAEAERRGVSVLSAFAGQELVTTWERLIQPAVFGALAEVVPITLVNDPRLPAFALANGAFILIRRDAYAAMGGHEAIKGQVSEDSQLARRAKELRLAYWLGDGRRLARTRMYRTPASLWEGWTKNLHAGARMFTWLVVPVLLAQIGALIAPFWGLYRGIRTGSRSLVLACSISIGAAVAQRRLLDAFVGLPWFYCLLQPLGQSAFLLLTIGSFGKVVTRRGVTWKGRRYYPTLTGRDG